MSEYQVLARKYRPKLFREVVGQESVVTTLMNALLLGKTAHAYLFCGSRGTGKTTLARLFAMALNCKEPSPQGEPCNQCSSCHDIAKGHSLDVLEIDGASHRGIEDIRQINETIGYASASGKYKIYLIDEVHMLTKEAFNALLKTLEEPPHKVKFLFATTEPHKIPATILSRCQRFNLRRIPADKIHQKLTSIASDLGIPAHPEALQLIAQLAEGGLRDAESLLDQVIAFSDQELNLKNVAEALGILPRDTFFALDEAARSGDYKVAFSLAKQVFSSGVHIPYFLEELLQHFRTHLLFKLDAPREISQEMHARYQKYSAYYTELQCLEILELLVRGQQEIKSAPSEQVALEMLLLRIVRIPQKLPLEQLVSRLISLEKKVSLEKELTATHVQEHISEDPSPRLEELPVKNVTKKSDSAEKKEPARLSTQKHTRAETKVSECKEEQKLADINENKLPPKQLTAEESLREKNKFETLMRFAAKELDGSLKKGSH